MEVSAVESVEELYLEELEQFEAEWRNSEKKVSEIWEKFRLLPLDLGYRIASHYSYDEFGWAFSTKWIIYQEFDENLSELSTHTALQRTQFVATFSLMTCAVTSCLQTQRKIVALEKLLKVLEDEKATAEEQTSYYNNLKAENAELCEEAVHFILAAQKASKNPSSNLIEIEHNHQKTKIDADLVLPVLEKMLYLYQEGYAKLSEGFFYSL